MTKTASRSSLAALLTVLMAAGGYGYKIVRDNDADAFESSVHEVQRIIDGDTIEIENDVTIRLLGLNAPDHGECYYEESKLFLEVLLEGKHILLEKDITGEDQYDRLLRYVYIPSDDIREDQLLVNDELLRQGYASTLAKAPDNRYRDLFSSAQQEAQLAERGLWAACDMSEEVSDLRERDSGPDDPECDIKGNISEKAYGRNYFVPGCPNYNRIKIDERKGEAYFCTEAEAEAAGFTRSASCANNR